jgi:hypothetical protein
VEKEVIERPVTPVVVGQYHPTGLRGIEAMLASLLLPPHRGTSAQLSLSVSTKGEVIASHMRRASLARDPVMRAKH